MEEKYSIEEILSAVKDLNKNDKNTDRSINKKTKNIKIDNSDIPVNTIKLIEEAEGN